MVTKLCAICRKNDATQVYPSNFDAEAIDARIFSARRLPDKIHYRMVSCNQCGLLYSNPILEPEKIEQLYRESTVNYDEQVEHLNATYGRYLKRIDGLVSKKRRLLDVGCGNGFFMAEAKRQGYREVWGVEPGSDSVKQAPKNIRKRIVVDVFRPKLFRANFFDCLTMFQTLDHLVDPNEALTEAYRVLKTGGVMLVILHDAGSWSARLLGESSPIIDIEHTYLYDKQTLQKMFVKHKFTVVEVFDVVNTHALGYWVHISPLPKLVKRLILGLPDPLGLRDIPVNLKAGNIGIVAKK